MKLLYSFTKRYFNYNTYYTFEFYTSILAEIIMLYVIYSLWSALYAQGSVALDVSREQLIAYAVMGMLFTTFIVRGGCQFYITDKIRMGTIDSDIIRPVNMQWHMFMRDFGEKGSRLVTFLLPIALIFLVVSGTWIWLDIASFLWLLLSVILAFIITFSINYLFGMLAFVTLNIQSISFVYGAIISFLAGQIVPLWLFPESIQRIVLLLPFRSIFDVPMSIYIGRLADAELYWAIAQQVFWAAVLLVLGQLSWRTVQKRIVSQGG